MSRPIQIATLTNSRIASVVRRALRFGLDAELVADFLARVDWTTVERASAKTARRLGQMELWATEYAEGDLTRGEYMARLASVLPDTERRNRLLFAPGAITMAQYGARATAVVQQSPNAPGRPGPLALV